MITSKSFIRLYDAKENDGLCGGSEKTKVTKGTFSPNVDEIFQLDLILRSEF